MLPIYQGFLKLNFEQSKLVVFNSLSMFLKHALGYKPSETSPSQDEADPTKPMRAWFLMNAFSTQDAFLEFEQLLQPQQVSQERTHPHQAWKGHVEFEDDDDEFLSLYPLASTSTGHPWTLQDLTNVLENPIAVGSTVSSSSSDSSFAGVSTLNSQNVIRLTHRWCSA